MSSAQVLVADNAVVLRSSACGQRGDLLVTEQTRADQEAQHIGALPSQ